jgi:hypothetical protein
MKMFWSRGPRSLVTITHVTSHRDDGKLTVRLAFKDRKPTDVIVSPEAVDGLATCSAA